MTQLTITLQSYNDLDSDVFKKNVELWILKQLFLLPLVLVTLQTILFVIKLCV